MDDKKRILDLENKVAALTRALSTIDRERQNEGRAPLFDAQILAINARVTPDLSGNSTPRVRRDAFPPAVPKGAA
ncbi:MAG: hypothetical protein EKK33_08960 [Bradyrhizobiaceae bacterium]|nr:MAG: hypothetical protein EKK33_08960 [Bradyrhizobiaceae bacterium]